MEQGLEESRVSAIRRVEMARSEAEGELRGVREELRGVRGLLRDAREEVREVRRELYEFEEEV